VAESKFGESASEIEQQKNGEKDKQVVADLVKKLLVCDATGGFVCDTKHLYCRPPELFSQEPAEKGSIIAWYSLPVLVSTNLTGTNARSERERVFCWFDSTLPVYFH